MTYLQGADRVAMTMRTVPTRAELMRLGSERQAEGLTGAAGEVVKFATRRAGSSFVDDLHGRRGPRRP